jgi:DMSO/TMAO reductase YedYZ molybdopterin-dependent catalytic subunit
VGAAVGLLSAGVALGVGEAIAAFVRPAAAPVIAVGNRLIVLTPEPIKRWAIRNFQTNDKHVLLTGIYVVLALAAMAIGMLALRRLVYGLVGITLFGAIGVYCASTANAARGTDVVPTIIGTIVAAAVLVALVRYAGSDADLPAEQLDHGLPVVDRRRFLVGAAATVGLATVLGFGGRAVQRARFAVEAARRKVVLPAPVGPAPVAALVGNPDLGKSGVPWQTPNSKFYRIDTALSLPEIDPKDWVLRVHGMVDRPLTMTYQDLLARPMIERWITMCCVSNEVGGGLISNAKFLGARLADIMREAGLQPGADQLMMTSYDGMTIGAPAAVVMDGRDSLLAIGMNGEPLPIAHGFPVRAVVPGLYGYVSACKWIVDIKATTFAAQQAYWVLGGWEPHPPIELESRIDTPRSGQTLPVGHPITVAGVAWDQHVGVSKVEVQVGDGAWMPAQLAPVPSTDTWRQWLVAWTPPAAGSYTLRVRATDGNGNLQTSRASQPGPAGATGWHAITVHAR